MNETTPLSKEKPFLVWVPWLMLVVALGVFGTTASTGAFPGLPAKSLCWHLKLDFSPTLLDSLWGRLVQLVDLLPGTTAAFMVACLSVLFGALSIALTVTLMGRVRYNVHDKHDPEEMAREGQARLLAAVTAGLYLMLNIPFWIVSTRSLPGSFHLFLLLLAAWLFSEYQRTGKPSRLYFLGLVYGVGITEFATFWIFAPMAALLVIRAMLQRAEFRWAVLSRTGLCLLPGLLLYVLNAFSLWQDPAVKLREFQSMWGVLWFIWRDQWHRIANAPQTTGFLLVMALTVVPWCVLFLLRSKRPAWRYRFWPVLLRWVVLGAALATLFNAPVSPWYFFGMQNIMITPYLILAACMGYVAGEFWVMGQQRDHRHAGIGQPLRSLMGWISLILPVAVLAAGFLNHSTANGRLGAGVDRAAGRILDDLKGRDVLLSKGVMDDSLRLQAHERDQELLVISLPYTQSKPYCLYLADHFTEPRQQALLQVGFTAFLQDFLMDDGQLMAVAGLDVEDLLREYGYLEPDHLITRVQVDDEQVNLPLLLSEQLPFWHEMESWKSQTIAEGNPVAGYRGYLLRVASKVANNLGFMQVEAGDLTGAKETFQQSRRLDEDNISALLNLLTIAEKEQLPELQEYQAIWEKFKERNVDSRVMWSLSSLYGYVYNTGLLVRNGLMWAVSGKPRMAEAELRRAADGGRVNEKVKAFLGRAYLHSGDVERGAEFYRQMLQDNPKDPKALLMLAELAMNGADYAGAEDFLRQAENAGIRPESMQFERAMLACIQGQTEAAVASLKKLVSQDKENVRAWALLAMLTSDGRDPELYDKAVKALRNLQGASPDVRLMLADLHMNRREWAQARSELEQVTRMNPRQTRAWEMLVDVDFQERKRELAEDHVRALLTLDPENYIGNLMLGSFQYARNQLSLAESSYRTAMKRRRDPVVMNDLAYLLMLKGEDEEALALIKEALAKQPDNPIFLSTRGELYLRAGRLNEAEQDFQQVLVAMPDSPIALLLSAQLYDARGQKESALEILRDLEGRLGEFPPVQQEKIQDLLGRLE